MRHFLSIVCLFLGFSACTPRLDSPVDEQEQNRGEAMSYLWDQAATKPDWAALADDMPFEKKKQILLSLGLQQYYNDILEGKYKYDYASHYYFVDLDRDGDQDIVYNSADGADYEIFVIWLNEEGGYRRIVRDGGIVLYLNWDTNSFLVDLPALGGSSIGKLTNYSLKGDQMISEVITHQFGTDFPSNYKKIARFRTTQETYHLRTSPEIKNEPCDEWPDRRVICGNIYTSVPKGTEGEAIAEYTDETGRVWWFSLISHKGTKKLAWLSSRFVESL